MVPIKIMPDAHTIRGTAHERDPSVSGSVYLVLDKLLKGVH